MTIVKLLSRRADEVCLEVAGISVITGVSIDNPVFDSCGNQKFNKLR